MTVLILALLWIAILSPALIRRVSEYRKEQRTYGHFGVNLQSSDRRMVKLTSLPLVSSDLGGSQFSSSVRVRKTSGKRRRNVLAALTLLVLLTFIAALALGGVAVGLHIAADVLLVSYLLALGGRNSKEVTPQLHAPIPDLAGKRYVQ